MYKERMPYVKSLLTGILGAFLAIIAFVVGGVALSMQIGEGASAVGFFFNSFEILAAAVFGFLAGFYWQFRRIRRSAPPART